MSSGLELGPPSPAPSMDSLDTEQRIETMVQWFLTNFEDPAQETPYNGQEGGYQYIWGGPYDALEELQHFFDDAEDNEHEAAVAKIEEDGIIDWAPAGNRIQPDDLDEDDPPPTLTEQLESLRGQLAEIEDQIKKLPQQSSMLGHNQPPEEYRLYFEPSDVANALESIQEIKLELDKPDPAKDGNVAVLERAEGRLRHLAAKLSGWAKAAGKMLVGGAIAAVGKEIVDDPASLAKKIETVAEVLIRWSHHLHLFL